MDVGAWLQSLGMGQYVQAFADNDVDAGTLRQLTERDLRDIGITSVGHRRRLLTAIAQLTQAEPQQQPQQQPAGGAAAQAPAECRQLSVLYCEMAGAMSSGSDDECQRAAIQSFHEMCSSAVAGFDGHFANFYGDRILAYFGWPRAHEDDPERAVRAGLRMVREGRSRGMPVRVSVGTGDVVVGNLIPEGPAAEQSAVGLTPNLAARLLAVATAGQMVVDELTRRLMPSSFTVQSLGAHPLKGVAEPVVAYLIDEERPVDMRFDARKRKNLMPMLGRDKELGWLLERWAQAQQGEGTAMLVAGEAGVGKSRLVRALLNACGEEAQSVRWQCSPYHTGSALWPVIQQLTRAAMLQSDDSADVALDKLEEVAGERDASMLYATLLGLNGTQRYGPVQMTPQMLRERTLEVLVEQLFELAERQPLLLVLEDAHWSDPTTLEVIERCLDRIDRSRMLLLVTTRPDNPPPLGAHPHVTRLSLNRLSRSSTQEIVAGLAGNRLKPQTVAMIVAQSDGVPLFAEELTKAVMETGETTAIPASLHGSLMARLDRLPEAKEVAQVAACIGREFDLELLQAVSDHPEAVVPTLDKLVAAELVFPRGDRANPRYTFKHALVQEAARESLLRKRREAIHGRILGMLEARPDTPVEILARHAAAAGLADRAIAHWCEAGKAALAKSAYMEAATSLESALGLIQSRAADPQRHALELDLLLRLGQCHMGLYGIASSATKEVFQRANELLRISPRNHPARLPVQHGLFNWHCVHGELRQGLKLALEALFDQEASGTPESLAIAQRVVATNYAYLGEFAKARVLYEAALPVLSSERCVQVASTFFAANPALATFYQYSIFCSLQGHSERGHRAIEQAYAMVGPRTTAFQRAYLHLFAAIRAALERDGATVAVALAHLGDVLAEHRMLPGFDGYIDVLSLWAAKDDISPTEQDIARHLGGLGKLESSGQRLFLPFFMARVAQHLSVSGRHDEAKLMIERASAVCQETGQCWCDAELWRVRGELALHAPPHDRSRAADCFTTAISLSRHRGARLWELRAGLSLAHLHLHQAQRAEVLNVLRPLQEWFAEEVDTADIVEARALLR